MNNQYKKNFWINIKFLNPLFIKFLKSNRIQFFNYFKKRIYFDEFSEVLDIGTVNLEHEHENVFINNYDFKSKLTCLSNQELTIIKKKYPEIKTIFGDARNMNIKDNSFDIVHSNATLEHVGDFNNQIKFIKECIRVSKKFVFIQTPNKNYPLEFHTKIPFIQYLPCKIYKKILRAIGLDFFADVNNLNLLTKKKNY
jgi:ubiquinone/menaquinone biosynthesis C-methylase UbiE